MLSPILFSLYLDKLLVELRELSIGCHMNGLFTGAFIYADDITIIAPSCYALNSMLNVCKEFCLSHDILFNSLKTKYMFFSRNSLNFNSPPIYVMNNRIKCVNECVFLGIHISIEFSDKIVFHTVHKFNRKCNELRYDFKLLPQLFSSFCLDAYGSQLWNFDLKMVEPYYVSWRKMVRLLWNLPRTTHCDFLSTINSSLPMDIALEKRCGKFFMG